MPVGIGYDIHILKKGRRLLLGGVHIPHPKGLVGHSDGDVLLHALTDAVLGALGQGDIGEHFSDKDRRWKDADSVLFAKKALSLAKKSWRIEHMDAVVVAEEPKLAGHKLAIRRSIAKIFDVPLSKVNVKAKTNEGLDAVGRGEAIACHAIVQIRKK